MLPTGVGAGDDRAARCRRSSCRRSTRLPRSSVCCPPRSRSAIEVVVSDGGSPTTPRDGPRHSAPAWSRARRDAAASSIAAPPPPTARSCSSCTPTPACPTDGVALVAAAIDRGAARRRVLRRLRQRVAALPFRRPHGEPPHPAVPSAARRPGAVRDPYRVRCAGRLSALADPRGPRLRETALARLAGSPLRGDRDRPSPRRPAASSSAGQCGPSPRIG